MRATLAPFLFSLNICAFSMQPDGDDLNEVEGEQRCRVIATITSNQVENGRAVLIANDRLAIGQAGTHGQFCDRDYYARKAMT
jgi:hypothetical protein